MRIDKYLKVSRILKRRTISKKLALNQRIELNGRIVKPSHEVNVGDVITITFGNRKITIQVQSTEEIKRKKDAIEMYQVLAMLQLEQNDV